MTHANVTIPLPHTRYERKFFVSELTREEVESLVALHPAMFSEAYPPRDVNSLYLDSVGLLHYFDHVDGNPQRLKVRIRWYGTLFGMVHEPTLELKSKRGPLISKAGYPLTGFVIEQGFTAQTLARVFEASPLTDTLRLQMKSLEPVALIRYRRTYLRSADHRFRLTLDWQFHYYRVTPRQNTFIQQMTDAATTVIELKYGEGDEESVEHLTRQFPLRVTKSSKYLTAMQQLAVW